MTVRSLLRATLGFAIVLAGCSDGPVTPESRIASVQVVPSAASVAVLGRTEVFSAVAKDANGSVVAGVFYRARR